MIVDSSAIIAILLQEPGYEELQERLDTAEWVGIGAPTMVEAAMVLSSRLGPSGKTLLARLIHEVEIEIVEFTEEHWTIAAHAFLRFGKGRHPAGLNFGDCLTYATCRLADLPLLFIGDDFPQTDVEPARKIDLD